MEKSSSADSRNERPTLVYVSPNLYHFHASMIFAVADIAQEQDVNLICLISGVLNNQENFEDQGNVLFDLIRTKKIDGLIFNSISLNLHDSFEEMGKLIESYRPVLATSIGLMDGVPSIGVECESGMREMMDHLIDVHHYSRIAYIRGPEGHPEAEARYRAYTEALARHNIRLDPRLAIPPRDWGDPSNYSVKLLLDERKLQPKVDVEVIMGNNDETAAATLSELQARGVRVPRDIAVVGFDDLDICRVTTPPLSSVYQPIKERARWAAETLLKLLQGQSTSMQYLAPTHLVVRQSCGCESPAMALAGGSQAWAGFKKGARVLTAERAALIAEIQTAVGGMEAEAQLAGELIDALAAELQGEAGVFLRVLESGLWRMNAAGRDVGIWQGAISVLQRRVAPHLENEPARRMWAVLDPARVLLGEIATQAAMAARAASEKRSTSLGQLVTRLSTMFDVQGLVEVLADGLPKLDIPSGYLALYEDPQPYAYPDPAPAYARLRLAYTEHGRVELEATGRRFPTRELIPPDVLPVGRRCTWMALPLYFQSSQLGYMLLEVGPRDESVYEKLQATMSNALKGALLVQQRDVLLGYIAENAGKVNQAADMLAISVQQTDQATTQVAASIEQVATGAQQQATSATTMTASVDRMANVIQQVVAIAEAGAQETSQAARIARAGAGTVAESVQSITNIKAKTDISAKKMQDMAARSTQIGQMVESISEIAYQTNLLALNAAMEAARAGEHGRGFEVVAKEVRNLAKSSAASTKEINAQVRGIQRSVEEAIQAMQDSAVQVDASAALAGQAGDALEQILTAVDTVNQQVHKITTSTQDLTSRAQDLITSIEQIANISQDNRSAAEHMAGASQEMRAQMQQMAASTQTLRALAQALQNLLM